MTVSMYLPCYDSIKRFAEPRMQKYFGDLMVDPSNNFDVSLEIDLQNIKVKKGMMFLIHMCTIHIRVYIYIYVYVCMCVCVLTWLNLVTLPDIELCSLLWLYILFLFLLPECNHQTHTHTHTHTLTHAQHT